MESETFCHHSGQKRKLMQLQGVNKRRVWTSNAKDHQRA